MRSRRADRRTRKGNYKEKTYRETEVEKSVKERVNERPTDIPKRHGRNVVRRRER